MDVHEIERQLEMCPPAMRDWVLAHVSSLAEIMSLRFSREILPDGFEEGKDGQHWARWKPGPHFTVHLQRGNAFFTQPFIKDSENEWRFEP